MIRAGAVGKNACSVLSLNRETEALLPCHSTQGWFERVRERPVAGEVQDLGLNLLSLAYYIWTAVSPLSPRFPAPQHLPSPPDPLLLCLSSGKCRSPRDFNQTWHKSFSETRHKPFYQGWVRHFRRRQKSQ